MILASILLKEFSNKGLLCGGGAGIATELLFTSILLKQKCAKICELQINTSRSDVESLDKMLVGLGQTFEGYDHNVLFLHLATNGTQLITDFLNPIQVSLERCSLIHENREQSILQKEGSTFVKKSHVDS